MNAKIDVLDENLFYMDENEMRLIWESFARPMEIQEEQGDCIERLEELSNVFQGDLRIMQSELHNTIAEIQTEFESI